MNYVGTCVVDGEELHAARRAFEVVLLLGWIVTVHLLISRNNVCD